MYCIFYGNSVLIKNHHHSPFPEKREVAEKDNFEKLVQYFEDRASGRGIITEFSSKSKRNLIFKIINRQNDVNLSFTLTYHHEKTIEETKKDLNRFLTNFKKKWKPSQYLWVLEFQKRGVAHFHLWFLYDGFNPLSANLKKYYDRRSKKFKTKIVSWTNAEDEVIYNNFKSWVARAWNYASGQTDDLKALNAGTRLDVVYSVGYLQSYAVKYLTKSEQKNLPSGVSWSGRWWGTNNGWKLNTVGFSLDKKAVRIVRKWLKNNFNSQYKNTFFFNDANKKRYNDFIKKLKSYSEVFDDMVSEKILDNYRKSQYV